MFEKGKRVHIWKTDTERIGTGIIKGHKFDKQKKSVQYLVEFNEPKPDQYFNETYVMLDTWQGDTYYIPVLGEITVDLMYDYWDRPLIYTGETQSGQLYFFVLFEGDNTMLDENGTYIKENNYELH